MWLWWIYTAVVLVAVTPLVLLLAVRIVRTALEIHRYGGDIRTHARGIGDALEPAPAALTRTAELVAAVRSELERHPVVDRP